MSTPSVAATLKAVLDEEGLHVVEHGRWANNNRGSRGSGWGPIEGILIQPTGQFRSEAAAVDFMYRGDAMNPGPLCHIVVDRSGVVHLVGWGRANHAFNGDHQVLSAMVSGEELPQPHRNDMDGNSALVGIRYVSSGQDNDKMTEPQYTALARAAAAVSRFYGWNSRRVISINEWTTESRPVNTDMVILRDAVWTAIENPVGEKKSYTIHTVAQGDTLYKIAKQYLGDGRLYTLIASVNRIPKPFRIQIGQELKIPNGM